MLTIQRIRDSIWSLADDALSYNISKKGTSNKWIKSCIFPASVLILIFFTVLNLATNGYDLQPKYITDPNTTESERHWYHNRLFTWGDDKLEPKCQHTNIPVGYEFMTTNLGLRYTVRRILHFPSGSPIGQQRSSISYHNNLLTNCEINVIGVYLKKADISKPNKNNLWWSWMDSSADAVARCDIINDDGFFTLEFLVKYATMVEDYSYIAVDDATTHASFWWGTRLLNAYFIGTQYVMSGQLPDSNDNTPVYTHATFSYKAGNTTSMKDPKLFDDWYFFLESDGGIYNEILDVDELYNKPSFLSRPLTEGFFFAKVFRSLILADLGNSQAPNLLLDPDLLQYALNPGGDDFNREPGAPLSYDSKKLDWWRFTAIPPPDKPLKEETAVLMDQAFVKFKGQTGPLKTKPAFIYAEYICSVPMRRAASAVALYILIANYTMFLTAWALFKYILDMVTEKGPAENCCEGCLVDGRELIAMGDRDDSLINPQKTKSLHSRSSSTRGLLQDENLEDGNGYN
ncbi:hypothetical protein FGG08_003387 [Glutinoglossum americanum]|uniref:Transmembrane protein n=1 Tax=Glutinoglossum americanum TaxID=1670608 RepID=A0A9P8IDB6_9PEZI|nr:hypothetical protein FGG08_003387 [Glutinoglossum americanum]